MTQQDSPQKTAQEPLLPTDQDVVIVGAAMTGATLACALAGTGLRVALLDRAMPDSDITLETGRFEPRVSALTPASASLFEQLGVWGDMARRRVSPYSSMRVWEADGTASISFDASEIHADMLGYIVENRVIQAALHRRLDDCPDVERLEASGIRSLQRGGDAVLLRLDDGRSLRTRLLVGADGARSTVRRLAGFRTREWEYGHRAIVTTVKVEQSHQQTAWQRFSDEGVLAFLPLRDAAGGSDADRYCSIVWSLLPERAEQYLAMDPGAFAAQLGAAFEHRLGAIQSVAERFSFPLYQCHATEYVQDRVALIGDAAHSIHPLAGQGANLGLLDARALADVIIHEMNRGMPWDEPAVLRRYQRRRMGHNLAMAGLMEGFRRLYADQPLPLRWLRNTGMQAVDRLAPLKHRIMREATGVPDAPVKTRVR
ncbi:MAG: UbiH/UbiF/VisC/COQ6 family ubiquinone biosynthesis hydroxylase [Pseudohongiellaceae bacterium]